MNTSYDDTGKPLRCDCGRPPALLRGEQLSAALRLMDSWNPEWESHIEYVAKCSGSVCQWSEFTVRQGSADQELVAFLSDAYKRGVVQSALKRIDENKSNVARLSTEAPSPTPTPLDLARQWLKTNLEECYGPMRGWTPQQHNNYATNLGLLVDFVTDCWPNDKVSDERH